MRGWLLDYKIDCVEVVEVEVEKLMKVPVNSKRSMGFVPSKEIFVSEPEPAHQK